MRIVHAADLHLDSPLLGLERYDGAPVEQARSATRRAFTNVVDLCLEQEAPLLLLAGDLFDGEWRDYQSGLFFLKEIARLREIGARVVLVHGNHDAVRRGLSSRLALPGHVTRLDARRPETCRFEEIGVAIHGQSYARPDVDENLAEAYPPPRAGLLNIGLLHANVGGVPEHGNYAPCRLEQLQAKGYDYWALGHVHRRARLAERPWAVYPGCTQGRHARETGPKGCALATVEDGEIEAVEFVDTDVMRWVHVRVEAQAEDRALDDLLARVEAALGEQCRQADGRLIAARVTLAGEFADHASLARDPESAVAGVRALAIESEEAWVEKVAIETRPPLDIASLREGGGALGGLLSAVERRRREGDAGELVEALEEIWSKARRRLGDGCELDLADPSAILALLEPAEALLVTMLQEGAEGR